MCLVLSRNFSAFITFRNFRTPLSLPKVSIVTALDISRVIDSIGEVLVAQICPRKFTVSGSSQLRECWDKVTFSGNQTANLFKQANIFSFMEIEQTRIVSTQRDKTKHRLEHHREN